MDQVVFQSEKGYFLRIMKTEISVTKKNAMGVRGMKLTGEDGSTMRIFWKAGRSMPLPTTTNHMYLTKSNSPSETPKV